MWLKHYVAKNIKVANILSMIIILSGTPNDQNVREFVFIVPGLSHL